ncbi:hydroxymethylpyrimidine/phosphomethylpyrimidine kinase [Streptoalloteichus tenebrarius]|uniref:Hydroxymethylpyrimidine/phosphomethylpyrimidine kinase n=1 Tax=Streptoalloteichus tenebrarius (strain ATCC 17920 / DSM 40477 / JCM 4838 / CBS 697.72 / NBRC 16177 / NCIMB 11028 / NRRL B-12390 / A12253. 1 / ISP 5477) TaxID=1933 RepID=A0ABT1HYJ8_STRSD|nr:hydroxymethylpyrimidine/phosphomethylpyrimidine kinase [Streptoalloteichus tenebrarius]BFF01473.1 bifunctional hydroxymethylpyrimidine kinase/phosphomethylpyrimidine kinase [Streptoalloteichus tenebrarius]
MLTGSLRPAPGTSPARALTIAGSDSGGGAGIQADLRTFHCCGVHGMSALTAVTVQNSVGVTGFHEVPVDTVVGQVEAVVTDIGVDAVKTGMLASAAIIRAVDETCGRLGIGRGGRVPLVVDPVAASMHGDSLLRENALDALRDLFALATLVTPNLDEVRLLTGIVVRDRAGLVEAAKAVHALGAEWVLIKAGHLVDDPDCVDVLHGVDADGEPVFVELPGPRFDTPHTHGGGDTLASAITSALARGAGVVDAVRFGKRYVVRAVGESYPLGSGVGPVTGFWRLTDDPV